MSLRLVLPTALAAAAIGCAAHAEEAPVATGRPEPASAPTPPPGGDPVAQLAAIPTHNDLDPDGQASPPDRKPHGYVSVGIGTGGYRAVAGGIAAPLGQDGFVAVEVASERIDARRR